MSPCLRRMAGATCRARHKKKAAPEGAALTLSELLGYQPNIKWLKF